VQTYYLVVEGKIKGPFRIEELQAYSLKADSFVKQEGTPEFKEAHELPELCAFFGFTRQLARPQYFASFDQRLLAWFVDVLLIALVLMVFLLLGFALVQEQSTRWLMFGTSPMFILLGKLLYNILAEAGAHQATLGKRLMKIKVTDLEGRPLEISTAIVRNSSKLLSIATCGLGYFWCFLNKKQQALHDVMANTLVVKERLL